MTPIETPAMMKTKRLDPLTVLDKILSKAPADVVLFEVEVVELFGGGRGTVQKLIKDLFSVFR